MQQQKQKTQYEIVNSSGEIFGPYSSFEKAAEAGVDKWPDQKPHEDWDIQVAGFGR